MKTKLLLLATSILAVLSPVKPMIYVAILAIMLDTSFGIWRSVMKGGWKAIKKDGDFKVLNYDDLDRIQVNGVHYRMLPE